MTFIKNKIKENIDWDSTTADEIISAGIETLSNQDNIKEDLEDSSDSKEKYYDWHDILDILSDYFNPSIIEQLEDDWILNYPDNMMPQSYVADLLNDISFDYNEELASEIMNKISRLQNPKEVELLDLSTDIDVLKDALDKISNLSVKEKLINFIDSLEYGLK